MKIKKIVWALMVLFVISLLLAACGHPNPMKNVADATGRVAGFWQGLWDGLTVGWAWLLNLFGGHYGLYEVHNNGGWYDFGFIFGIGLLLNSAAYNAYSYGYNQGKLNVKVY